MNVLQTIRMLCTICLFVAICSSIHAQERPVVFVNGGNKDSLEFLRYRELARIERKTRSQQLLNFDSLQLYFANRSRSDSLYAEALTDYIKDLATQWKTKQTIPLLQELENLASKTGSVDIWQKLD